MADVRMASDAARRAAECLLRSTGGRTVYLRMAAPGVEASVNEQLGLSVPEFQDAEMSPVVFRKAQPQAKTDGERWELMVSAISVEAIVGDTGVGGASELFREAAGVVVDGSVMEIESATSSDMDGAPYVYRLVVRVPQAKTI